LAVAVTRRKKREDRIRRNVNQVRFSDLDTLLQENSFNREEGDGSHKAYRHPRFDGIVTVSPHGAFVKPYQVRQALAALDTVRQRMEGSS
jgi:predicted RNA binding protein YcfA (HicA-like mRNA interferase family)